MFLRGVLLVFLGVILGYIYVVLALLLYPVLLLCGGFHFVPCTGILKKGIAIDPTVCPGGFDPQFWFKTMGLTSLCLPVYPGGSATPFGHTYKMAAAM